LFFLFFSLNLDLVYTDKDLDIILEILGFS